MQTMKNRSASSGESGRGQVSQGGGRQVATGSVVLGDVIFTRLRGGSWWPAQVVDDNSVNESMKPSKRLAREVLVRLYGSYIYKYADPVKCRSEFETVLKNSNGSYQKILQEALEQDLPSAKACRSKESSSKNKGTSSKCPTSKRKSYMKNEVQNKVKCQKQNQMLNDDCQGPGTTSLGKPQELSARRIRVMESLGLIAPPGSPFVKNGRFHKQGL